MSVKDILQVLYAPHRVFKKIVQNPGYAGPIVLLIIFGLAQIAGQYYVYSRSYLETTTPQTTPLKPQGDLWTENAAFWTANEGVIVSNNTLDYINGTLSTTSIQFTASNTSQVWMQINFNGSVTCGSAAFQNVSFRVKQVNPSVAPENVGIYLYSLSESDFYYDLTGMFASSVLNEWNNITLPVGAGAEGWTSSGDATWENITGLKLDFSWSDSINVDLRVDRLFFRGNYGVLLDLYGLSYFLTNSALNAFAPFLVEWLLLTGLMYVMIKVLKGNVVWRPLMVAVGFALVVIVIQSIILIGVYTALPNIYYPLEVLAGAPGEFEVAYQTVLDAVAPTTLATGVVQAVIYIWTVILGTFSVRAVTTDKKIAEQVSMGATTVETTAGIEVAGFSWMKCLLVSGVSLFVTIILLGLILGL